VRHLCQESDLTRYCVVKCVRSLISLGIVEPVVASRNSKVDQHFIAFRMERSCRQLVPAPRTSVSSKRWVSLLVICARLGDAVVGFRVHGAAVGLRVVDPLVIGAVVGVAVIGTGAVGAAAGGASVASGVVGAAVAATGVVDVER
jgi:hypothetical protein